MQVFVYNILKGNSSGENIIYLGLSIHAFKTNRFEVTFVPIFRQFRHTSKCILQEVIFITVDAYHTCGSVVVDEYYQNGEILLIRSPIQ